MPCYDFSDIWYKNVMEMAVPRKRGGKFVVVLYKGATHIGFSPSGLSNYHANIVDRLSGILKIKGVFNKEGDVFRPITPGVVIAGGGTWLLDESQNCLKIEGKSFAYGLPDFRRVTEELQKSWPFSGDPCRVSIPSK